MTETLYRIGLVIFFGLASLLLFFPATLFAVEFSYQDGVVQQDALKTPESCGFLQDYLKFGEQNDPVEVAKLQYFLRQYEGVADLYITGEFNEQTLSHVHAFQRKYAQDILAPWGYTHSTGYVYLLTKKKINEIVCGSTITLSIEESLYINEYKKQYLRGVVDGDVGTVDEATQVVMGEVSSTSTVVVSAFPLDNDGVEDADGVVVLRAQDSGRFSSILSAGVGSLGAATFSAWDVNTFFNSIVISVIVLFVLYVFSMMALSGQRVIVFLIGSLVVICGSVFLNMMYLVLPFFVVFLVALSVFLASFFKRSFVSARQGAGKKETKIEKSLTVIPPRTVMKISDK